MRGVTWKHVQSVSIWEGTVKGDKEATFFVQGRGFVTDIRESKKSETFIHPKHYKISETDEGKRLAEDLVNGTNFEKHEANRLALIAESQRTAKLIQDTDKLIYELKLKNALKQ